MPRLPQGIPQQVPNAAGPAPVGNRTQPAIAQIRDMANGHAEQNRSAAIEKRSADAMDGSSQRDARRDEFPAWVERETRISLADWKRLGADEKQLENLRKRFARERPMAQSSIDVVNDLLKRGVKSVDADLASRDLSEGERAEIKRMRDETLTVFKRLELLSSLNDVQQNIFDHIRKGKVMRKTLYRVMDAAELQLWHRAQKLPDDRYVDSADTIDHLGQYAYPSKVLVAMTALCVEHEIRGNEIEKEHLAFFIEDVSLIGGYGPGASADYRPVPGDAVPIIVAPNRSEQ